MKLDRPQPNRGLLAPTAVATLALLIGGATPTWAQSTLPLDEVYHYGRMWAEHDQACSLPEVVTSAEFGVITFKPDGSFGLSGMDHTNCSGGQWSQSTFNGAGTYTLSIDGGMDLDLNPAMPGTETAHFDLSWDGMVALGEELLVGEPALTLALRGSTGLGNDALAGEYGFLGLAQDNLFGGGIEGAVDIGTIVFDGAGGYQVKPFWYHLDPSGKSEGIDPQASGTYSVRATDGRISFDGDAQSLAAVSPDGRMGFAVEMTAGESTGMTLFVRKPTPPVTPGAFDLDWKLGQYGAELSGGGPTEVELASAYGLLSAVPAQASFSHTLDLPYANSGGGGIVLNDTGGGTFTLPTTGLLQLFPSGSPANPIHSWLCASEDVAIFWDVTNSDFIAGGVLLREWGPLAVDTDQLSATAGGTQTMTLRAGVNQASLPYLVLGSATGVWPGFALDGKTMPLNLDPYTNFTIASPNTPPLAGSFGVLDASGAASASFSLPSGAPASLIGLIFSHAYATIKLEPTLLSLPLFSNPVECRITP